MFFHFPFFGLFPFRFFSPLGMAPVVGLVGLGLFQRGFPQVGNSIDLHDNFFSKLLVLYLRLMIN